MVIISVHRQFSFDSRQVGSIKVQTGLDSTVRCFDFSPSFHLLVSLNEKNKSTGNKDERFMLMACRCEQIVARQQRRESHRYQQLRPLCLSPWQQLEWVSSRPLEV